MAVSSELWTDGKQDAPVCIMVDDYDYKIVAWASNERLTSSQMVRALEEEYPGIEFDTRLDVSPGTIYAVGKRQL